MRMMLSNREDQTGKISVNIGGKSWVFERNTEYDVSDEIIDVLSASHEAPYLRILNDRISTQRPNPDNRGDEEGIRESAFVR